MTASITAPAQAIIDTGRCMATSVLRIKPVNGAAFGICQTNVDITLDDGQGAVTYYAAVGFDRSAIASTSGQAVDNAEARAIQSQYAGIGISAAMVDSGYLDDAKFWLYLVDTASNTIIRLLHYGFLGEMRTQGRMIVVPELVGLSQMGRQKSVCQAGSGTCRAVYGDASTGCPATPSWSASASASGVGGEADRVFTTATAVPKPGNLRWVTGANAGLAFQVESVSSGTVTLETPTPYAIAPGDTFQTIDDCDKTPAMCKARGHFLSFRGEPHRKEAFGDALNTPGAAV